MQFAQYYQDFNGPMTDGFHRDHSAVGLFFGLVFLVTVMIVAYYLVRALAAYADSHESSARDPLEIARERFAKGEISKDELAEIKKELK